MSGNSPKAPSRWLTIEEAAAYIHPTFKPSAIRKAIRSGNLVANKFGGRRLYIEIGDLNRFIKCPQRDQSVTSGGEAEHESPGRDMVTDYFNRRKL